MKKKYELHHVDEAAGRNEIQALPNPSRGEPWSSDSAALGSGLWLQRATQ